MSETDETELGRCGTIRECYFDMSSAPKDWQRSAVTQSLDGDMAITIPPGGKIDVGFILLRHPAVIEALPEGGFVIRCPNG